MKKLLALLILTLCAGTAAAQDAAPQVELKTSAGTIVIELYPDKAPETVKNFLTYVREGFYSNTLFHRVIQGFMVQGGGFNTDMDEKPTHAPIHNEAGNGIRNTIGTVAMARTSDPHSATAQFFINVADNDFLNYTAPSGQGWGYAVFGKVVKGMDAVRRIAATPTDAGDMPKTPVVIESATVLNDKPAKK